MSSDLKKEEMISIREFARRMKVSPSTVRRAIKRGRITAEGEGRGTKIPWNLAKREFEAKRDYSKIRKKDAERLGIDMHRAGFANNGHTVDKPDLWNARARKEEYLAKIRELDYLERVGQLVRAKEVEDAAFRKAREVRDAILNIPDRIASLLANENDPARCHEILRRELEDALNTLAQK